MDNNINYEKIQNDGFCLIKSFLNENEVNSLKKIVLNTKSPKGDKKTIFAKDFKSQCIKFLKLEFKKFFDSRLLIKLSKKKGLPIIANKIFNKKINLNMIDAYYSKISNIDVLPWHCDQAYSGKEVVNKFYHPENFNYKFFFYLTPVGPENGCTSYIPGSHRITYLIRKGIYENKIKYSPYWTLEQLRTFLSNEKNYAYIKKNLNDSELLDKFLEKTSFINNKKDIKNYDFFANPGDLLIFNEGGVHKGSKVSLNDRMVVRYLFSGAN